MLMRLSPTRSWRITGRDGALTCLRMNCLGPRAVTIEAERNTVLPSSSLRVNRSCRGGEVEGDVDDQVLLAADQTAPADFEQDGSDVDSVAVGGCFGMA